MCCSCGSSNQIYIIINILLLHSQSTTLRCPSINTTSLPSFSLRCSHVLFIISIHNHIVISVTLRILPKICTMSRERFFLKDAVWNLINILKQIPTMVRSYWQNCGSFYNPSFCLSQLSTIVNSRPCKITVFHRLCAWQGQSWHLQPSRYREKEGQHWAGEGLESFQM